MALPDFFPAGLGIILLILLYSSCIVLLLSVSELALFIDSEIWPNITEVKDPLEDHEKFKNEENKFDKYFEENI